MPSSLYQLLTLIITLNVALSHQYCEPYNCYELLGVSKDDDEQTIKKAFREMARKHHPDKNRQ